jgi:cytoskeletal protein CcmA (bactofilin family)
MSLFGKSADSKQPEAPPVRPQPHSNVAAQHAALQQRTPAGAPTSCTIGSKTTVKGDLLGDEDVVIDGTVEGLIRISKDVRIGQGGVVKATVEAASVVISGEMVGDCTATQRVELQATGRLTGNIRAPRIVIAEGAMFRGNSAMTS